MSFAAACAPVPLIGQSSRTTRFRASRRRRLSFNSSVIVLASITMVPGRAPAAIPCLPKNASSIAAGEGNEVIRIRVRAATSAHERAARPPALVNALIAAGATS